MKQFEIKTENFEGPLHTLLDLVEKRKLLINEVSLASVTDDYLHFVENLSDYSLSERTEFIVVASTLLLIKSRSLLPHLTLTPDEEESIDDLEKRLKILQEIREGGKSIGNIFGKQMLFFGKGMEIPPIFSPHASISLESVVKSLEGIVNRFPKKEVLQKASVRKVISLEEMIERLTTRIQRGLSMSFKDFSGGKGGLKKEEKVEVIVGFLAMLELVKQGIVAVAQEELFTDITMESTNVGTPRY